MFREPLVVVVAVGLMGCGGGGSGELKIRSGATETVTLSDRDPTGGTFTPAEFSGTFSMQFSSTSKRWGEDALVALQFPYGVGTQVGLIDVRTGRGATGRDGVHPHGFLVEEWRFTGNGSHPFHVKGRSADPSAHSADPDLEVTRFEVDTNCASSVGTASFASCGAYTKPDVTQVKVTRPAPPQYACPDEVLKAFYGAVGATGTYNAVSSLSFEGADATLGCVATRDSAQNVACGATREVKSGACTWHASAFAAPAWDSTTNSTPVVMFVGAWTDKGCAEVTTCNTTMVAPQKK